MIPEIVKLNFDPKTASREVQDVFSDDIARTIWLTVRSSHPTSQYFNTACLYYAKVIKEARKNSSLTAKQLLNILSGDAVIGKNELDFAIDLLPFINGEKAIKFEINIQ